MRPGTSGEPGAGLPASYALYQNYPNPLNPSTTIKFRVAHAGFVSLKVFDILGHEVATLVAKDLNPGTYKYEWNIPDLASGVYFYRLDAAEFSQSRKLLLLK